MKRARLSVWRTNWFERRMFSMAFDPLAEGNNTMPRDQEGFSLIELLVVVAIILVIAAIAIPSFLRSRIAANQASAIESLRVLGTAEVTYSAIYGNGYSATLSMLGPPPAGTVTSAAAAGLIDDLLAIWIQERLHFHIQSYLD